MSECALESPSASLYRAHWLKLVERWSISYTSAPLWQLTLCARASSLLTHSSMPARQAHSSSISPHSNCQGNRATLTLFKARLLCGCRLNVRAPRNTKRQRFPKPCSLPDGSRFQLIICLAWPRIHCPTPHLSLSDDECTIRRLAGPLSSATVLSPPPPSPPSVISHPTYAVALTTLPSTLVSEPTACRQPSRIPARGTAVLNAAQKRYLICMCSGIVRCRHRIRARWALGSRMAGDDDRGSACPLCALSCDEHGPNRGCLYVCHSLPRLILLPPHCLTILLTLAVAHSSLLSFPEMAM